MKKRLTINRKTQLRYNRYLIGILNKMTKNTGFKTKIRDDIPTEMLEYLMKNKDELSKEDMGRFLKFLTDSIIDGLSIPLVEYDEKFIKKEKVLIENFIAQNTLLIKDIEDDVKLNISRVVRDGVANGLTNQQLAKGIGGVLEASRFRCETIAITENAKIHGQLNRNRMESMGLTKARWSSAMLPNTRKCHRLRHGKIFDLDKGCYSDCDAKYLHVGQDVRCRCTMSIVF